MKYKYDKESDVLSVTLHNKPFSYAREAGDFVVHFDKNDKPVYVEILNAHEFLKHASRYIPKSYPAAAS
jgi:uncharacterized protein YuzE